MFKGMGDMINMARQMQERMNRIQEELAKKEATGTAGAGMVTVKVNGKQEVTSLKIDPSIIDPADPEMLEDLVYAAVNDGLRKAREMAQSEMGELTGGINIPGLSDLLKG